MVNGDSACSASRNLPRFSLCDQNFTYARAASPCFDWALTPHMVPAKTMPLGLVPAAPAGQGAKETGKPAFSMLEISQAPWYQKALLPALKSAAPTDQSSMPSSFFHLTYPSSSRVFSCASEDAQSEVMEVLPARKSASHCLF